MKSVRHRRGFTLTELVVASLLLISMMAIVAPLTVRSARLWRDTRHQQLALDELSNQIEFLSALDDAERERELESLQASEEFRQAIPSAVLSGETQSDPDGSRLVMTLKWQRSPGQNRSVSLVGWLEPSITARPDSEDDQ